jgi:hypothetical protein
MNIIKNDNKKTFNNNKTFYDKIRIGKKIKVNDMNMCCTAKNHDCFSCRTCSKPKVGCRSCLICISCTNCINKKCEYCKNKR